METLLLQSKSKKEMQLFADLAKKIGLKTKFITIDDLEDIALANAMNAGRTGEYADTAKYLKKLRSK